MGSAATALRRGRAPLLAVGALALLAGLWGALARLGVTVAPDSVQSAHGILLVMGFLGVVIGLERAVALGTRAAYAAPALAAAGTVATLLGLPLAPWLFAAAAAAFASVCLVMYRMRPEVPTAAMAAGGAAWVVAAVAVAMGVAPASAVPLLAAFLVLTVGGERVGLSRLARPPRVSAPLFAAASALLLAGAAAALVDPAGARVAGAGLLALAAWLALWDIAWRNVRRSGVTRYMATALVAGYAWLAVAGVVWVLAPGAPTVFLYDAFIHAVTIGFVLSMIFAHELMIVPALLGITLRFTRAFYVPLVLLHASLAARIAGDVLGDANVWRWAGATNVAAVLLFLAVSVASALRRSAGPVAAA